jgi:hypothetical protein
VVSVAPVRRPRTVGAGVDGCGPNTVGRSWWGSWCPMAATVATAIPAEVVIREGGMQSCMPPLARCVPRGDGDRQGAWHGACQNPSRARGNLKCLAPSPIPTIARNFGFLRPGGIQTTSSGRGRGSGRKQERTNIGLGKHFPKPRKAKPATVLQRPQALVVGAPTTRQPRCGRREKTFSQKMAEAERLQAIERERARARQVSSLKQGDEMPVRETFPEREQGRTRDKVAAAVGLGSGRTYDKAANLYCHSTANRPETGRHQRTTRSRRKYPKASIQATFGHKRTRAQRGDSELNIAHIVEAGGSSPFLPTTQKRLP